MVNKKVKKKGIEEKCFPLYVNQLPVQVLIGNYNDKDRFSQLYIRVKGDRVIGFKIC